MLLKYDQAQGNVRTADPNCSRAYVTTLNYNQIYLLLNFLVQKSVRASLTSIRMLLHILLVHCSIFPIHNFFRHVINQSIFLHIFCQTI